MRSFKLGRAFGIPVYVHWTFFLLPLAFLLLSRSEGAIGMAFTQVMLLSVFGCVLLHELGHSLMARHFGIGTRDITLYPIGGVARLESTGQSSLEEVCIALAGPAVNLVIVMLLLPLVVLAVLAGTLSGPAALLGGVPATPIHLLGAYLFSLCVANGALMLFNLIPAFPMDGGRVLRAILAAVMGRLRGTEVAATVALFVAGGLGLLGVLYSHFSLILVSGFVVFAGQAELYALRRFEAGRRAVPVAEVVVSDPEPSTPLAFTPELRRFTGLMWDGENQVWVRWVDGRPVEAR